MEQFPLAEIEILPTSGVCSFYIEESGVFIGYENWLLHYEWNISGPESLSGLFQLLI